MKEKKDAVQISIRMEKTAFNLLEWYCEDAGQTKTLAIERAVKAYVEDYKRKQDLQSQSQPDMNNRK